jgi:hypothetical protein
MHQLPTTFDEQKALASNRLQRLPTPIWASVIGLGVLGAATAWMLEGTVLGWLALCVLLGAAYLLWRSASRKREVLVGALEQVRGVDLWFHSSATGLVFFDAQGIFVESRGRAFKYEPTSVRRVDIEGQHRTLETRLAAISYEEKDHAIKLQLVRHEVETRGAEAHEALLVPLPQEIAGDRALQVAVEANRKAARAS